MDAENYYTVAYELTVKATAQDKEGNTIKANADVEWSLEGSEEPMPSIVYTGFDSEYNPQYLVKDFSESSIILKATSKRDPAISATIELTID